MTELAETVPSVIVLGSGRSGTSLVAGLLESTGRFHFGKELLDPSPLNPKGFFEDEAVNRINERMLARFTRNRSRRSRFSPAGIRRVHRFENGQRWLCALPSDLSIQASPVEQEAIADIVPQRPYCMKDPRFSYTLGAWQPMLGDFVVVCVFRAPGPTIASILQAIKTDSHLASMKLTMAQAEDVWCANYRSAIARWMAREPGQRWLFLDYQDLLEGDGVGRLGEFVAVDMVRAFVDSSLARSGELVVSERSLRLYDELRSLSAGNA